MKDLFREKTHLLVLKRPRYIKYNNDLFLPIVLNYKKSYVLLETTLTGMVASDKN